jgi:hypothetical protein
VLFDLPVEFDDADIGQEGFEPGLLGGIKAVKGEKFQFRDDGDEVFTRR